MDLAALDRSDPAAWYSDSPAFTELADVELRVEGVALPAHSQVLARASPVLQDMLRERRRGSGSSAAVQVCARGAHLCSQPRVALPLS